MGSSTVKTAGTTLAGVAARINGTLSPKRPAQSMSPVEGDRSERTLGLGCGFKLQGHARTRRPGSGGRAAWQATGLLGLPLRAFAARPDSIGAARPLWSAECPLHVTSCHLLLAAQQNRQRSDLNPGLAHTKAHDSSFSGYLPFRIGIQHLSGQAPFCC